MDERRSFSVKSFISTQAELKAMPKTCYLSEITEGWPMVRAIGFYSIGRGLILDSTPHA